MTSPDDLGAAACHELLVRLAGRLPDRLLWRLREWLAAGAHAAVAALLPRALLRNRVGLTDEERDLLEAAVAGPRPAQAARRRADGDRARRARTSRSVPGRTRMSRR